jgi:hypothetical protein
MKERAEYGALAEMGGLTKASQMVERDGICRHKNIEEQMGSDGTGRWKRKR